MAEEKGDDKKINEAKEGNEKQRKEFVRRQPFPAVQWNKPYKALRHAAYKKEIDRASWSKTRDRMSDSAAEEPKRIEFSVFEADLSDKLPPSCTNQQIFVDTISGLWVLDSRRPACFFTVETYVKYKHIPLFLSPFHISDIHLANVFLARQPELFFRRERLKLGCCRRR